MSVVGTVLVVASLVVLGLAALVFVAALVDDVVSGRRRRAAERVDAEFEAAVEAAHVRIASSPLLYERWMAADGRTARAVMLAHLGEGSRSEVFQVAVERKFLLWLMHRVYGVEGFPLSRLAEDAVDPGRSFADMFEAAQKRYKAEAEGAGLSA